jgi:cytochrome bd-type quinol oxidase subunit 1
MGKLVIEGISQLSLARGQFAATSIYHFLFVPVTIGLAFLVAILQTTWHRHGDEDYLRLTHFFGALLLINVAVGVVTGLVQEFQFGMAWSDYSRFVGDVFGAPLAIEGLAAFFLESTFIGLWVFGWGRLSKRVHLATIWLVAAGSVLSAAFIMAANAWMQHPVGYEMNTQLGRAQLTSIWALLTNPIFLWAFAHVLLAALVVGGGLMLSVSAWHLLRRSDALVFRKTARISILVLIPAAALGMFVGSEFGVRIATDQPMKIGASEALWNTAQPAAFSMFQIGGFTVNDQTPSFVIKIPHLLSVLATNSWNGKVLGMNQVQAQYEQRYGPGNYMPNSFIAYWSIRVMAYLAGLMFLLALWGWWLMRRHKIETSKWFLRLSIWAVVLPFLMTTTGWVLTENGRQPWIVQGLLKTAQGISPSVSTGTFVTSLIVFIALYGAMAIVDLILMIRFARRTLPPTPAAEEPHGTVPAMTY